MNNAFSTFFVTGLYMLFWDYLTEGIRKKSLKNILKALLLFVVPILCAIPSLSLYTLWAARFKVLWD